MNEDALLRAYGLDPAEADRRLRERADDRAQERRQRLAEALERQARYHPARLADRIEEEALS